MIQRFLGVSVGALVTILILWLSTVTDPVDLMPWYVAAAVIGAIASFLWPVVIGFWLGRRARARRDESIQKEVDKQLAEQNKG
jgi:Na+/pantothenate symporter